MSAYAIGEHFLQVRHTSMVTLALSSGSGTSGSTITLDVSITSTGGDQCSQIQWDFVPQSGLSLLSADLGAAGIAANKSLSVAGNLCVIYGSNQDIIGDGVLVSATFSIAPWASGALTVGLSSIVASDENADPLTSTGTGGTVTATALPTQSGSIALVSSSIAYQAIPRSIAAFTATVGAS